MAYGGGGIKHILTYLYFSKLNEIIMCHLDLQQQQQQQKTFFNKKNDINSINNLYTGSHKSFSMHYDLQRKKFKAYFSIFIL